MYGRLPRNEPGRRELPGSAGRSRSEARGVRRDSCGPRRSGRTTVVLVARADQGALSEAARAGGSLSPGDQQPEARRQRGSRGAAARRRRSRGSLAQTAHRARGHAADPRSPPCGSRADGRERSHRTGRSASVRLAGRREFFATRDAGWDCGRPATVRGARERARRGWARRRARDGQRRGREDDDRGRGGVRTSPSRPPGAPVDDRPRRRPRRNCGRGATAGSDGEPHRPGGGGAALHPAEAGGGPPTRPGCALPARGGSPPPCTQEIAVFIAFSRLLSEARDHFLVLDTAPTGHTLMLLDTTGAYHRSVERTSRSAVVHARTPLMRLQDAAYTRVLIVTLAEATPVQEAAWLRTIFAERASSRSDGSSTRR